MINFVKELIETADLSLGEINNIVSFCCIGGKIVVVNNYIRIMTYATTHVVLKVKGDELIIEGSDILIKQLNKNDICLVGNIARVYFAKEVKKYDQAQ